MARRTRRAKRTNVGTATLDANGHLWRETGGTLDDVVGMHPRKVVCKRCGRTARRFGASQFVVGKVGRCPG